MLLRVIFQEAHWNIGSSSSRADEAPRTWKEGRFCERASWRDAAHPPAPNRPRGGVPPPPRPADPAAPLLTLPLLTWPVLP